MGYLIQYINQRNVFVKCIFGGGLLFCILLNQFQWWQYKNYILDPYRTTKDYYWATFLKTKATGENRDLLLVYRDFSGRQTFNNQYKYQKTTLLTEDFEEEGANQNENNNHFRRLNADDEYLPVFESTYNEITKKDHLWIKISFDIRFSGNFEGSLPCIVNSMERKIWSYGYSATEINLDSEANHWRRVQFFYLTPELRSDEDSFKCFIWKRSKSTFDIDNLKLEVFKRKN